VALACGQPMFERVLQGSSTPCELLSPQSSNPTALWKVTGGVQRVYDKALKGHAFQITASGAQSTMQWPKDEKSRQSLGLVHPFLVFQVLLPQNREKPFSLELGVTDGSRTRRRLLLSASFLEAQTSPQHARLPLSGVRRGAWLNLCLDMDSLVRGSFGRALKSVDSVVVHPECRLRKIFTMRSPPLQQPVPAQQGAPGQQSEDATADAARGGGGAEGGGGEEQDLRRNSVSVPRPHDFPLGIEQHTQVIGAEQVFSGLATDEVALLQLQLAPREGKDAAFGSPSKALRPQDASPEDGSQLKSRALMGSLEEQVAVMPAVVQGSSSAKSLPPQPILPQPSRSQTASVQEDPDSCRRSAMGYEDMVRRPRERDERLAPEVRPPTSDTVAVQTTRPAPRRASMANDGGSQVSRAGLDKCAKGEPPKSAEGDVRAARSVAAAPKAVSTAPPSLGAACQAMVATTTSRRSRGLARPSGLAVRGPSDPGSRRLPATARGASDRSPSSNAAPRRARPLPLEMIGMPSRSQAAREDFVGSCAPPSSCRRSRRSGRPPSTAAGTQTAKQVDDDSLSPTANAATRRRREVAMKTLHKTAEIYGVHKQHGAGPRGGARTAEEPLAPEDEVDSLASCMSPNQRPDVVRSMRYAAGRSDTAGSRREVVMIGGPRGSCDSDDDVGEPPPIPQPAMLSTLEALTQASGMDDSPISPATDAAGQRLHEAVAQGSRAGGWPPRREPGQSSATAQPPAASASCDRRRRPLHLDGEPAPLGAAPSSVSSTQTRSSQGVSSNTVDIADGQQTPASSASLASPSRVLAAQVEANDVIVFDAAPDLPSLPTCMGFVGVADGPCGSCNALSAFNATVRHHQGCWPPLLQGGGGAQNHDDAILLAVTGAQQRGERSTGNGDPAAWGGGLCRGSPVENAEPFALLPVRSQDATPLIAAAFDVASAANDDSAVEPSPTPCRAGDGLAFGPRGLHALEEQRRIKSLSPPRRWRRPQPIAQLSDDRAGGWAEVPSAPSSAPSEHEIRRPSPFPPPPRRPPPTEGLEPSSLVLGVDRRSEGESRVWKTGPVAPLKVQPGIDVHLADTPHRPFTPPVVPVGKLLRGVFDSQRAAASSVRPGDSAWAVKPPPGSLGVGSAADAACQDRCPARHSDVGAQFGDDDGCVSSVALVQHGCSSANDVFGADIDNGVTPRDREEVVPDAMYDPILDIYYDARANA